LDNKNVIQTGALIEGKCFSNINIVLEMILTFIIILFFYPQTLKSYAIWTQFCKQKKRLTPALKGVSPFHAHNRITFFVIRREKYKESNEAFNKHKFYFNIDPLSCPTTPYKSTK
jgi:hypothetical protein